MLGQKELRLYTQERLDEYKSKNDSFSLRSFASRIGFSAAELSSFLAGKRNFSKEKSLRLLENFQEDIDTKLKILSLLKKKSSRNQLYSIDSKYCELEESRVDGFTNYLSPVVYSILRIKGQIQSDEIGELSSSLDLSEDELWQVIENLEDNKMIEERNEVFVASTKETLSTGDKHDSSFLRDFYISSFRKASQSLLHDPSNENFFMGSTLAITEKDFKEVKQKIIDTTRSIKELNEDPQGRVYFLQTALFPITKK